MFDWLWLKLALASNKVCSREKKGCEQCLKSAIVRAELCTHGRNQNMWHVAIQSMLCTEGAGKTIHPRQASSEGLLFMSHTGKQMEPCASFRALIHECGQYWLQSGGCYVALSTQQNP